MSTGDSPRNVLFLFTDQQRWDSLSCYGGNADTPAVDSLAARGTRFDRAYTPTAICTPARTAIVSGRRPGQTGVSANVGKSWTEHPKKVVDEYCFPNRLAEAGYAVDLVGKSHFGCDLEKMGFTGTHFPGAHQALNHPAYREYLTDRGLPQYDENALERLVPDPEVGRLDAALDPRPVEASFPRFLANRAIERLERFAKEGTPFHLGVHFFGPHRPYIVPQEYYELYNPAEISLPESAVKETFGDKPAVHEEQFWYWQLDRVDVEDWRRLIAVYRGFVRQLDDEVGRILEAMEELELREETAVFFSSDHGAFVTRHKLQDKGPAMYEDIYRVPLIADIPGTGPNGASRDELVSLMDLSPTFLDLADQEIPEVYEGRSLLPLARGETPESWREDLLLEFNGLQYAYPQRALVTDRHKLVVNPPDGDELYDLAADPAELTNRIDDEDYAAIRERLYDSLAERLTAVGDDFPAREDNFFPGRHPARRPTLDDN